jgi:hypothetical protein
MALVMRNLFNANVREPTLVAILDDLPLAPRAIYLQATYKI